VQGYFQPSPNEVAGKSCDYAIVRSRGNNEVI
jgi:hypothetical protein